MSYTTAEVAAHLKKCGFAILKQDDDKVIAAWYINEGVVYEYAVSYNVGSDNMIVQLEASNDCFNISARLIMEANHMHFRKMRWLSFDANTAIRKHQKIIKAVAREVAIDKVPFKQDFVHTLFTQMLMPYFDLSKVGCSYKTEDVVAFLAECDIPAVGSLYNGTYVETIHFSTTPFGLQAKLIVSFRTTLPTMMLDHVMCTPADKLKSIVEFALTIQGDVATKIREQQWRAQQRRAKESTALEAIDKQVMYFRCKMRKILKKKIVAR